MTVQVFRPKRHGGLSTALDVHAACHCLTPSGPLRGWYLEMTWFTSQPIWLLVIICLGAAVLLAVASRMVVRAAIPEAHREHALVLSTAVMSPLGAGFAILAALTLANDAQHLGSAESIVSSEAGDASRLAWAATTPGVDTDSIHTALTQYLQATRTHEWHGANAANGDDTPTSIALARLENAVRVQATRPALGNPTSTELLAALDALTTDRRARLAAAASQLPGLYVIILTINGAAPHRQRWRTDDAGPPTRRSHHRRSHDRHGSQHRADSRPGHPITQSHQRQRPPHRRRHPRPQHRLLPRLVAGDRKIVTSPFLWSPPKQRCTAGPSELRPRIAAQHRVR